ncbi:MAG: CDP-diacylglycerol--serine O-phosphatidyltransferase [Rhizobiaceae bacterium]
METPFPDFDPHGKDGHRGPRLREIPVRLVWPNLITVLAICAGLTGIRLAFEERFETAVIMVLIAAFLDGIDGRVARMLKATSRFGAQMDSLADIVNFGVAPALVLYAYVLGEAHSFGWIAALLFAIACGMRLARFNVMSEAPGKAGWQSDYFVGVPAPAGAVLVLLPVYLGFLGIERSQLAAFLSAGFTVFVALLLVSRVPVFSGKNSGQRVRGDMIMPLLLLGALYVLFLTSFVWQTMSVTAIAYLLFLPFSARMYGKRLRQELEKESGSSA